MFLLALSFSLAENILCCIFSSYPFTNLCIRWFGALLDRILMCLSQEQCSHNVEILRRVCLKCYRSGCWWSPCIGLHALTMLVGHQHSAQRNAVTSITNEFRWLEQRERFSSQLPGNRLNPCAVDFRLWNYHNLHSPQSFQRFLPPHRQIMLCVTVYVETICVSSMILKWSVLLRSPSICGEIVYPYSPG